MKTNTISVATLLLALLSMPASGAQWTTQAPLKSIYAQSSGDVWVNFEVQQNPDGCINDDWYVLDKDKLNFDVSYSILLAGSHTGKDVKVNIDGCTSDRPKIQKVISY